MFQAMKFSDIYKKPMVALGGFVCRASMCLGMNRKGIEKLNPIFRNNFDERFFFSLFFNIFTLKLIPLFPSLPQ